MTEKPKDLKFDITQLTGMPLDEARAIIWPFRGIRKPIGVLLEQGELTVRDIAWASENAYDPRLKQAAQTILVSRLLPEKLKPSLSPAPIIQGSTYTSYQRRIAVMKASLTLGVIFGIGITFISAYAISFLIKWISEYKELISNIYGILFVLLLPVFLVWMASKYADENELYRIGEEAENQAVNALHALLHEPWTIIRNFVFPERKWGDIDLIVVGISGVWAFEVKGYTSSIRNTGDRWQYKNKFGWWKLGTHPGKQAKRNALRLKNLLDLKGVNPGWVQPVVLWAGDDIQIENPETPVWKLSELPNNTELWKNTKLTVEQIVQIKKILQETLASAKK
jgi:hypothetical protein